MPRGRPSASSHEQECSTGDEGPAVGPPQGDLEGIQRPYVPVADTTDPTAEAVRHLLAVQGQDNPQAVWALGLRSGDTRAAVEAALESGSVVRSWSMRGTLHFVDPHDLRWMLQLTGPRMLAQFDTRRRQLGLDQPTLDRAREVALTALSGGRRLGRAEFQRELEAAGIPTTGQRSAPFAGSSPRFGARTRATSSPGLLRRRSAPLAPPPAPCTRCPASTSTSSAT